ncbi:MAG: hypothetical protein Q9181_007735 [Wetmoreana brouardii]
MLASYYIRLRFYYSILLSVIGKAILFYLLVSLTQSSQHDVLASDARARSQYTGHPVVVHFHCWLPNREQGIHHQPSSTNDATIPTDLPENEFTLPFQVNEQALQELHKHYADAKPPFTLERRRGQNAVRDEKRVVMATSDGRHPFSSDNETNPTYGIIVARAWSEKYYFWTLDHEGCQFIVKAKGTSPLGGVAYRRGLGNNPDPDEPEYEGRNFVFPIRQANLSQRQFRPNVDAERDSESLIWASDSAEAPSDLMEASAFMSRPRHANTKPNSNAFAAVNDSHHIAPKARSTQQEARLDCIDNYDAKTILETTAHITAANALILDRMQTRLDHARLQQYS